MAARERRVTWLELAVRNGGFRHGVRALTFTYLWGITRVELGREPTVEDVATFWNASIRTTYRDQASFRTAFPDFSDPSPIVDSPECQEAIRHGHQLAKELEQAGKDLGARLRRGQSLDSSIMKIGLAGPA